MPLVLRDRVGIFGLFPIFFLNIAVSTAAAILYRIEPVVGVVLAWSYMYVLLLQTRIMVLLIISGWIGFPTIAYFVPSLRMDMAILAMSAFSGCVVAAHVVAFGISAVTGFRL